MNDYTFIKYSNERVSLDIRFSKEENTIWMNQSEMAVLFNRNVKTISKHIINYMSAIEHCSSVVSRNENTASDGKVYETNYYNLEIIKQVGYKIDPIFTDAFITWAKEELSKLNNQIMSNQSNIIRFNNGFVELDVTVEPKENTLYLSKDQLTLLFDTTRQNIEYHLSNIYEGNELEEWATCKEILQVQNEGGREVTRCLTLYNLDVILSIGYRINNKKGVEFRKWATRILGTYLYKGYVIDDKRTLVTNENYINLINIVTALQSEFIKFKKEKEISLPSYHTIYQGKVLDSLSFITRVVQSANKTLTIIDPYVDAITLSALDYRKEGVTLFIITSTENKITSDVLKRFPKIKDNTKIVVDNSHHDRYIIVDDTVFYKVGPSVNYLGNKFALIEKEDKECLKLYIRELVNKNIASATNICETSK